MGEKLDSSYDSERSQPLLILLSVLLGLGLALIGDVAALAGHLITPLLMGMPLPISSFCLRLTSCALSGWASI